MDRFDPEAQRSCRWQYGCAATPGTGIQVNARSDRQLSRRSEAELIMLDRLSVEGCPPIAGSESPIATSSDGTSTRS